jgi:hypothetical protein
MTQNPKPPQQKESALKEAAVNFYLKASDELEESRVLYSEALARHIAAHIYREAEKMSFERIDCKEVVVRLPHLRSICEIPDEEGKL